MQIKGTYDTTTWVRAYYTIWQGMLSLTDREVDLLCLVGLRQLELSHKVLDPVLLSEMLLSTAARQAMRQTLAMSTNHFQNTLTSLLEKGALLRNEEGHYQLSRKLVPQQELTFTFAIQE